MKFGRLLRTTAVDLPEMEALFSAYKSLKVRLQPGQAALAGLQARACGQGAPRPLEQHALL